MKKSYFLVNKEKGFTLMELIAVLLIVGILAGIGVPRYIKTAETSRADEARALVQLVYTANRMFKINNPTQPYTSGALSGGHTLVVRGYVQNLNAANMPPRSYTYHAVSNPPARIACAIRDPGAGAPYNAWFYGVSEDGETCSGGGAPDNGNMPNCGGSCP